MQKFIGITTFILTLAMIVMGDNQDNSNAPSPKKDRMTGDGYIINPTGEISSEFGLNKIQGVMYTDKGIIKSISGDLNANITATDRVERCYQLFNLHGHLFGIENAQAELLLTQDDKLVISFCQVYNNIKVIKTGINVYIDENGHISAVNARFYPEAKNVNTMPSIDEKSAVSIAMKEYKNKSTVQEGKLKQANLEIVSASGNFKLIWRISISELFITIDASSGDVLSTSSALVF